MDYEDILLKELLDMPGEIFDIPEMQDEKKFDVEDYINGEIDYWHLVSRLPNQLARWHSANPKPCRPVLIIGAWTKQNSFLTKTCRICRTLCLTQWHPLRCQSIGFVIVSMLTQRTKWSTSLSTPIFLSLVSDIMPTANFAVQPASWTKFDEWGCQWATDINHAYNIAKASGEECVIWRCPHQGDPIAWVRSDPNTDAIAAMHPTSWLSGTQNWHGSLDRVY